jgi:hypothetical protein
MAKAHVGFRFVSIEPATLASASQNRCHNTLQTGYSEADSAKHLGHGKDRRKTFRLPDSTLASKLPIVGSFSPLSELEGGQKSREIGKPDD